jgi:dTDP-4-dehydrorhamnose reductase
MPLRVLIVGGDGTIGRALRRKLTEQGLTVIVTTRRPGVVADGAVFLDFTMPQGDLPRVDVAVICAAMTRFNECRDKPELAWQINVAAPAAICENLVSQGTRVIFLSTSAVFDCRQPRVNAAEPTVPCSVYGRLKAAAERQILALGERATVLRLSKVLSYENGVLPRWIGELKRGDSIEAFEDHGFCPITIDDAVDGIVALVMGGHSGIYQASGSDDISFAEAARHLAFRLGVPSHRVIAVKAKDCGLPAEEITPFTSLDSSRLTDLTGFIPPHPLAVIDRVFAAARPACV